MRYLKIAMFMALSVLVIYASASAKHLEKRHQIELRIGMWNQVADVRTEIFPGDISTSVGNNGFMGGLTYGYWLQDNLALNIGVDALNANVNTDVNLFNTSTSTAYVTSVLMGIKYNFLNSSMASSVKPFVKLGVGPFVGNQAMIKSGFTVMAESRTETVMGGQVAAGVDFLVSRYFMTGLNIGYNFMTDFEETIGGSKNYSGPELGFSFSLLLGKGVE